MTTLAKRKRRNKRIITPLSERLFPTMREHPWSPWSYRSFPRHYPKFEDLKDYEDFFDEDLFDDTDTIPAMNVKEHDNNFEIELVVPGFSKEDFTISIEDHVLEISGENREEEESKDEDFTLKEFSYKSFKRSIAVSKNIDLDQDIKASYNNGILKLSLLKKELAEDTAKKVIKVI